MQLCFSTQRSHKFSLEMIKYLQTPLKLKSVLFTFPTGNLHVESVEKEDAKFPGHEISPVGKDEVLPDGQSCSLLHRGPGQKS